MQRFLEPDSLTQYTFKKPKRSKTNHKSAATANNKTKATPLSPFAKMVLDNTAVSFQYLTPEQSPEPQYLHQEPDSTFAPQPPLATPQLFVKPTDVLQNGLIPSRSAATPSSSQQRQVSAVVPESLFQAQRAEYQYMPDQHSSAGAQYLTPSKPPASSNANRTVNLAQRQKGDLAVNTLNDLLVEIFQAEDQAQPDTSGQVATHANAFFEVRDTDDGAKPVLRPEVQLRLESAVTKAASHGRLTEIETEHLIHVQQLCEIPVAAVDSLVLSVRDDWTDQDTEEWLQQLSMAEQGLAAGRTLTQIMAAGAHLKELQDEGHMTRIISALKSVVQSCVIPIVEERPLLGEKVRGEKGGPPSNPKYITASNNRQTLQGLLIGASRAMRYLGKLIVKTNLDGSAIAPVEYLCTSIIFAENASVERESALGVQNFETMRRTTMDVYATIFTKYPQQRQSILDDIMSSIEKLPATKQSARHYKLVDAKSIQLVSALLMRLVQTSATRTKTALQFRSKDDEAGEEADVSDVDPKEESESDEEGIQVARKKAGARPGSLAAIVQPLHETAKFNCNYIVSMLISRALKTSKSSDEPHRKLLDIFTEDFLNVLGSSDWPAAEMLLRTLVMHMIGIVNNSKSPAPHRTLALELLGVMGSGIIELQLMARHAAQSIDTSEEMASRLKGMLHETESGLMETTDLVALDGPYRIWAEYLNAKGTDEDALLQSAHGYMLMQWAYTAVGGREGSVDSDAGDAPGSSKDLDSKLREMLLDPNWLDERSAMRVGSSEGRLAVLVATLNTSLCKAFQNILKLLLNSMDSDNATVRSRGLKSVNMLLDKDPTMLDRDFAILNHMLRCAQDKSSLVRDSALGLIDKCITLRPTLDSKVVSKVIERTKDAGAAVRKRAMKMLKDIYLRNPDSLPMRSAIADAILIRITDSEEAVAELARTTMEEIWFHPLYRKRVSEERDVDANLAFRSHAALVIATADREEDLKALDGLVKRLTTKPKTADANVEVCRTLVAVFFDGIIDSSDIPGTPAQSSILRSLTIFARATPTLFTAQQLERLEPYTQNLTKTDELEVYRYVITIFRHVMPNLTMMKTEFLQNIQGTLLKSSTRLQKPELREVAPCLWTMNRMLGNIERLVNFVVSVLQNIYKLRHEDLANEAMAMKVSRLMVIASEFGNACDFQSQLADFKAKGRCDWYRGDSVPGLIVETLCAYASPKRPVSVRRTAIDGICAVSQAWPKQFERADVLNALETVFADRIPEIELVLVAGLEGFFVAQEVPEEDADANELPAGIASGKERLGRTYVASDLDGAATSLAQRFLSDVLRIALASNTEPAWIAARLVVSINKQGLVHPKDSGPALVALETCPNKNVASEAFKEHKAQHQKHESLFEKEYMRAVQQTFDYQVKVIGSPDGYVEGTPPSAKMHLTYEVLKTGKASVRKKFMTNISQKLDFDPAKLDLRAATPTHLALVRFCCENLALFDYDKVEDLLHLLASLEKIFSSTGSSVAQAIENDVLKMGVDNLLGSDAMVNGTSDTIMTQSSHTDVDPGRLRQLSVSAQIISIIWETRSFLRRVWNMQKYIAKTKGKDKDANKAPNRASNAPALTEAYLKRIADILASATSDPDQRAMCTAFVELISVDSEVKVVSDDEENIDMDVLPGGGYDTPSESSSRKSPSVGASGGGRGRKRKGSTSAAGTPRKRGKPRKSGSFIAGGWEDEDGGWD